jgi:hypothetical protein
MVTVTSPSLGAAAGEILEMIGEAVAGSTARTSSMRTRLTQRENRFMLVILY